MSELAVEITSGIIIALCGFLGGCLLMQIRKGRSLAKGIQLLLKIQLKVIYNRCMRKGYATQQDKIEFEEIYQSYHSLGKNGVMDTYRKQLLEMEEEKND